MQYRETWDLSSIPDQQLHSELGRRRAAARSVYAGPPRKLRPCPRCGVLCGAAELRYQHPKVCTGRQGIGI
jgi:hypothetical protein